MNKAMHNSDNARPNTFNYAQATRPNYPRNTVQPQQRAETTMNADQKDFKNSSAYTSSTTQNHGTFEKNYSSLHKSREHNVYNNYKKPSVQLPHAPPAETSHIQFGSINQNSSSSVSDPKKAGNISNMREGQYGNHSATDVNMHRQQVRPQQLQQKTEIPRSNRTANDAKLFTQPYAPRRDYNQGDFPSNNSRYYNNRHNGNYKNGYGKPLATSQQNSRYNNSNNNSANSTNPPITSYQQYPQQQPQQPQPQPQPQPHHHVQSQQPQQPAQQSPYSQPTAATSSPYHRSPPIIQQSPQLQNQSPQQHQTPPSMQASPNTNYTNVNISPSMANLPSQSIPMAPATWAPQYYYPQYTVPVATFGGISPQNRSYVPPTTVKKTIKIVDPNTGAAIDTTTTKALPTTEVATATKQEKFDFQIPKPNVSKRIEIVDPATRDRELREKREREEAELEAKRKAEEERLENERKAAEEKERQEREEKERLEREEKERQEKEREEKERKEKEEAERIERERLAALEAEIKKKELEEEARRKAEEEQELRRIKSELEAKKKKDEEERARSAAGTNISSELSQKQYLSNPNINSVLSKPPADVRMFQLIEDPSTIKYPSSVVPPTKVNGRLIYSVEFLKSFSALCKDTIIDLTLLNNTFGCAVNYKAIGANVVRERNISHRIQSGDSPTFKTGSRDGRMEMGKFNTGRPLNSRNNSSGAFMERQGSSSGRGGRGTGRQGSMMSGGMKIIRNPSQQGPFTPAAEPVAPLEKTENRWVPSSVVSQQKPEKATEDGLLTEEVIVRKVKALLNKLTVEKFDSISSQIFGYCLQSEKEEDGKALRTVIRLTFEKACDEPAFASMWARLCRKMCDSMTNDICDRNQLDKHGKPCYGVLLFRMYLFNRCQEEFEKGWKTNMPEIKEGEMMTDEYYAAAKAKRQGLGLIQFIGELFKLGMLSEQIMYGCLIKLCNDPSNAGDEEAESLCKLLTTVGKVLDSKPNTTKWINIVVGRMKGEMVNSPKLSSRVKFMIQDLLDLRKQNWIPRNAKEQFGPTTLAKIHELAEKDKEQKEASTMKKGNSSRSPYVHNQYNSSNNNMQRAGSFRGSRDHFQSRSNNTEGNGGNANVDGWNTVSSPVGDKSRNELSNFGKTDRSRSRSNILGPSNSPFPSLNRNRTNNDNKGSSDGRSSPAMNMFSALSNGDKPEERKKLQLLPRKSSVDTSSSSLTTTSATSGSKLSDEIVKRKSKNIIEEYFSIRDKKELAECVKELDDQHYLELFTEQMLTVVEKKAEDVDTMCDVMTYLLSEKLIDKEIYVKSFKAFMETFDDLAIDVPQAPKYIAKLLEASTITPSDEGTEDIFCHLN